VLGKVAIANGKLTYQRYWQFSAERAGSLAKKRPDAARPLGQHQYKESNYRDVLYVEELIGKDTVNTIPPATFDAFRDHGKLRNSLTGKPSCRQRNHGNAPKVGISMKEVTDKLTNDGVKLFADASTNCWRR